MDPWYGVHPLQKNQVSHDLVSVLKMVIDFHRATDDNLFVLYLPQLLHVQVDDWHFHHHSQHVVELLRKFLGVAEQDHQSFFLIDEFPYGVE